MTDTPQIRGKYEVGFDLDGNFVICVWRDAADYDDPAKANCIRLPFNVAVPICKMILASSGYGPDCAIFRKGTDRWHKVNVEDRSTETGTDLLLARMKMAHPEVDWAGHMADFHEATRTEADKFSILQQAGLPATREMVKLMEQGADAIRRQAAEAATFTDAQLQRAKEIDEQWNKLWTDVTRRGKQAALEIMDPKNWVLSISVVPGSIADRVLKLASEAGRAASHLPPVAPPQRTGVMGPDLDLTGGWAGGAVDSSQRIFKKTANAADMEKIRQFEIVRIGLFGQTPAAQQQKPKDQDNDRDEHRLPKAA